MRDEWSGGPQQTPLSQQQLQQQQQQQQQLQQQQLQQQQMMGGLTRNGSHRRSSYRYRGPWRGPAAEDDGPIEPMFHYPHSKQYYVQQQQQARERARERARMMMGEGEDGRPMRSHSTSPLDGGGYPRASYSPQMDLDRPSRSPSPHPTVSIFCLFLLSYY